MKAYQVFTAFAFALALSCVTVHSANAAMPSNMMHRTWAFKGVVTEVNMDRIEMMGVDGRGVTAWHKFRITHNTWVKNGVLLFDANEQMRREARNDIQRGTVVTVWYTAGGEALVIQNMAPWGLGEAYGPGDCASCAGSSR